MTTADLALKTSAVIRGLAILHHTDSPERDKHPGAAVEKCQTCAEHVQLADELMTTAVKLKMRQRGGRR